MSEIRERVQRLVAMMPKMTTTQYVDESCSLIADMLVELERVDAENECLKAWKAGAEIAQDDDEQEIRKQAARDCIEIIDKYPAFLFGTDAVGVKLNLSQGIKAHFKLGEQHD